MPDFRGVDVEHPRIVEGIKELAKKGYSKDEAQKIIGMPREVIDREYRRAEEDRKKKR